MTQVDTPVCLPADEDMHTYVHRNSEILTRYLSAYPVSEKVSERMAHIQEKYTRGKLCYSPTLSTQAGAACRYYQTNPNKKSGLSAQAIKHFLEQGYLEPIKLHDVNASLRHKLSTRWQGVSQERNDHSFSTQHSRMEWKNKTILELAMMPEIINKVASLIGENIKIMSAVIHEVYPGKGIFSHATEGQLPFFAAHSDTNVGMGMNFYSIIDDDLSLYDLDKDSVNVWISISGTDARQAPLFVFPKTQMWPFITPLALLDHFKQDEADLNYAYKIFSLDRGSAEQNIGQQSLHFKFLLSSQYKEQLKKLRKKIFFTEPGDCIIFNSHLMHGSDINLSHKTRLAISIRYTNATNTPHVLYDRSVRQMIRSVNKIYSQDERKYLNLQTTSLAPIIQATGQAHHDACYPIDKAKLLDIIEQKNWI